MFSFETKEDLIKFLRENQEGVSVFNEMIAGVYTKSSDIDSLIKNKNTILSEKKELQQKYKEKEIAFNELEERFNDISEKLANYEKMGYSGKEGSDIDKELAELKNYRIKSDSDIKILNKEKEKITAALTEQLNNYKQLEANYNNLLIDNALNKHFDEVHVSEEHRELLHAAFRGRASIEVSETTGERDIFMYESDGVLPISDFFKAWSISEKNKIYMKAPHTAGGGAGSGNKNFNGQNINDLMKLYNEYQQSGNTKKAIEISQTIHALKNNR